MFNSASYGSATGIHTATVRIEDNNDNIYDHTISYPVYMREYECELTLDTALSEMLTDNEISSIDKYNLDLGGSEYMDTVIKNNAGDIIDIHFMCHATDQDWSAQQAYSQARVPAINTSVIEPQIDSTNLKDIIRSFL